MITYHNIENRPKNGICVANHTSPIDVMVLGADNAYALVKHNTVDFNIREIIVIIPADGPETQRVPGLPPGHSLQGLGSDLVQQERGQGPGGRLQEAAGARGEP